MAMNVVAIEGRLVADPEMKYTANGVGVVNFRVAVDRTFANSQGQREADFFTVVAWRKLAETVGNHLTKGRLCSVVGRLQYRTYEAQDGSKRSVVEIVANEVNFLDSKKDGNSSSPSSASDADETDLPDDLPF